MFTPNDPRCCMVAGSTNVVRSPWFTETGAFHAPIPSPMRPPNLSNCTVIGSPCASVVSIVRATSCRPRFCSAAYFCISSGSKPAAMAACTLKPPTPPGAPPVASDCEKSEGMACCLRMAASCCARRACVCMVRSSSWACMSLLSIWLCFHASCCASTPISRWPCGTLLGMAAASKPMPKRPSSVFIKSSSPMSYAPPSLPQRERCSAARCRSISS